MEILKNDKSYIGKKVTVTVDRPIGETHPKHPDVTYPINYGYVEGLVAGDGEEQDVYILGINEPVEKAECVIIGIIFRSDDNEDKWVGVPESLVGTEICCECNIRAMTDFQERFHSSEIFALYEKTCGAVIFTEKDGENKFFLVKSKSGHVGFPKGHIEYGESEIDTANREIFEECGLKVSIFDDFTAEYTFNTLDGTIKRSVFFLGKFDSNDSVSIQEEEVDEDWLVSYDEAMSLLNWEWDKDVMRQVKEYLDK